MNHDKQQGVQPLLSVSEAARFLGISRRTLWQRTKDGLVRVVRDGRRVLYDMADLRAYVNRNKQTEGA